ncbi:MAG: catalase, partial [Desulfocapsa sp.]
QDSLSLSSAGKEIAQKQKNAAVSQEKGSDQKPLTEEDLQHLTELKQRDTEVRTHEQAHLSAAGAYAAGGASFSFTTGPNGKRYATSGEVPIDTSKEDSPAATILKMQTVRRAALAPANPSSADRAIAAQASVKEAQARKDLQTEENNSSESTAKQRPETTDEESETAAGSVPETSDYNRRHMASAYQAMAALTT